MRRHIDLAKMHRRFPFLKENDSVQGKLYIGLDMDKVGLDLEYATICYVMRKVHEYIEFWCWDGRVYKIELKGHMIVIQSQY